MRALKVHVCIDCGRDFKSYCDHQVRCPECQKEHRRAYDRERYKTRKHEWHKRAEKTDSMIVNGHVQVCKYMGSCFYGQEGQEGCAYALEEGKTRTSQGLWIVDGKCPAYRKKQKGDVLKRTKINVPNDGAEIKEIYKEYTEV